MQKLIQIINYDRYINYLPQLTRPHVKHIHKLLVVLQTVKQQMNKTAILICTFSTKKANSFNRNIIKNGREHIHFGISVSHRVSCPDLLFQTS